MDKALLYSQQDPYVFKEVNIEKIANILKEPLDSYSSSFMIKIGDVKKTALEWQTDGLPLDIKDLEGLISKKD
jgi:hypothetical protein